MILFAIIGFLALIVVPFIGAIVFFLRKRPPVANRHSSLDAEIVLDQPREPRWLTNLEIPELLFMLISPLIGAGFIYYFSEDIQPFALTHAPSLLLFYLPPFVAYWIARLRFSTLSEGSKVLIPYFLGMGMVIYALLFLHFLSPLTIFGGIILPYFGFPLFAPIPALLYNRRLWHDLNLRQKVESDFVEPSSTEPSWFEAFRWTGSFQNGALLFGLIGVFILAQVVIGQPLTGIYEAFRGGDGFLFSLSGYGF